MSIDQYNDATFEALRKLNAAPERSRGHYEKSMELHALQNALEVVRIKSRYAKSDGAAGDAARNAESNVGSHQGENTRNRRRQSSEHLNEKKIDWLNVEEASREHRKEQAAKAQLWDNTIQQPIHNPRPVSP
jgi:hypothetical protein